MRNIPELISGHRLAFRQVTLADGTCHEVPHFIVRQDEPSLAGWQLRFGEWTDYPDRAHGGVDAAKALEKAVAEMIFRMNTLGK